MWLAYDSGMSIGQQGSEGGTIIKDKEHGAGARITLEQGGVIAPFSITCSIYGFCIQHSLQKTIAFCGFDGMRALVRPKAVIILDWQLPEPRNDAGSTNGKPLQLSRKKFWASHYELSI